MTEPLPIVAPPEYTDTTAEVEEKDKIENATSDIWAAEYPDGGTRAWLVVFGVQLFVLTFQRMYCEACSVPFGYVNAWGVFQAYYTETLLKDSSPSNIAWIGSIQYSLIFIPGLVMGHYFDRGIFKVPFFVASVLLVVATFLCAECTKYWHFLLCQGFATGLGAGILFSPVGAVMGHWFHKRRGLAMGLVATGSSIGGTVFPIIARNLIPRVGFPWTLRIMAFILLCSLTSANLTVKRRLPPKHVPGGLLNPAAFKNPAYTVYCISGIVSFFGLYTVLTYLDVSATTVGVSPDFSFYLISMANGASLLGRLMAGFAADRFGAANIVTPMCGVAAVMTYVWPLARSQGSFVAIAIIYGFSSGAYVSSFTLPIYHLGEISDVGRRIGMSLSLTAIGALAGPPISGAISTSPGGFRVVGYYAGSMILASIILMLVARHLALGKFWGKF